MKKGIFLLLGMCYSLLTQGQASGPETDFRPPLDIPLILSGTFGELRSNHFHSGIDIKTQQREGLPVLAAADGTISRIKISHWGYGKVLYVSHPSGHTTVYAHLQKFGPGIEEYVKALQYQKQSYELEVFPDYGDLKVSRGDTIAFSGNTGGSSGPHLHFEIRNSVDERPANPLSFGMPVRDATNPTVTGLYAYPLSDSAQVNRQRERTEIRFSQQPDGSLLAEPVLASGRIGFGIAAYDRQDMAANKNGVYQVRQTVNGQTYSQLQFDAFSFGETRYINTLIDYGYFARYRNRIQKCFRSPGNYLSIFQTLQNEGRIDIREGQSYQVEITVADLAGNQTLLRIPVEGKTLPVDGPPKTLKTPYFVYADKPASFRVGPAQVYFPAQTFYENTYLDLDADSLLVRLHEPSIALHRNFTLTFDVAHLSAEERKQSFIALLDEKGSPQFQRTYRRGDTFTARSRSLGRYTLARDTVAPKITPRNFKERQWLTNYRYLSLQITDDLSGIATYSARLNGQWILMEYEPKNNTLTYTFDDRIENQQQCELEVEVTDNVGNTRREVLTFFRS
ncbi:M23 family metallopeptidase [Robiginitalea marina]|uniref:M23 family metallopeptidase n=1 Tax=Robiginitalea marina TaxID=2954105 RepID=A0ABT1AX91_9FLAO|nr:M23 family metallopeptidase [Robiginitalea marina]MCO5723968.1 M23 family metallopeptidase [Robiginitalea marina]